MTSENEIQSEIRATLNYRPECTIYRNNTGAAKMGQRWVRFGLCKGSSDLIGYTSTEITPEMVGSHLAVFTALEVKKPGGQVTFEQVEFGDAVKKAGGIFAVVESVHDAEDAIRKGIDNE